MSETGSVSHTLPGSRVRVVGNKRILCSPPSSNPHLLLASSALPEEVPRAIKGVAQGKRQRAQGAGASSRTPCPLLGNGIPLTHISPATGAIPVLCTEPLGGCHPNLGTRFFVGRNPVDQTKVDTQTNLLSRSVPPGMQNWSSARRAGPDLRP